MPPKSHTRQSQIHAEHYWNGSTAESEVVQWTRNNVSDRKLTGRKPLFRNIRTFELSCDQLITFECFYYELDNFCFDLIRPSLVSDAETEVNLSSSHFYVSMLR